MNQPLSQFYKINIPRPETLSREEIIQRLENRQLFIAQRNTLTLAQLINIYNGFITPSARREPRKHLCKKQEDEDEDEDMEDLSSPSSSSSSSSSSWLLSLTSSLSKTPSPPPPPKPPKSPPLSSQSPITASSSSMIDDTEGIGSVVVPPIKVGRRRRHSMKRINVTSGEYAGGAGGAGGGGGGGIKRFEPPVDEATNDNYLCSATKRICLD